MALTEPDVFEKLLLLVRFSSGI